MGCSPLLSLLSSSSTPLLSNYFTTALEVEEGGALQTGWFWLSWLALCSRPAWWLQLALSLGLVLSWAYQSILLHSLTLAHASSPLLSSLLSPWAPGRTCPDPFCRGLLSSADVLLDTVKYEPTAQSMRDIHVPCQAGSVIKVIDLVFTLPSRFPRQESACFCDPNFSPLPPSFSGLTQAPVCWISHCREHISKLSELSPWNYPPADSGRCHFPTLLSKRGLELNTATALSKKSLH